MSDALPPIAYASVAPLPPSKWSRAIAVPIACLAASWSVGVVTNGVSGLVSRTYFDVVVGWMYGGSMTWSDVVFQGLLESTAFGTCLAFVVTLVYCIATSARLPLRSVVAALGVGIAACLCCWLAGGAFGVAWAWLSPVSFRHAFVVLAPTGKDLVRWAFVGGSIWGVYVGGLVAVVAASIDLHRRWRRRRLTGG